MLIKEYSTKLFKTLKIKDIFKTSNRIQNSHSRKAKLFTQLWEIVDAEKLMGIKMIMIYVTHNMKNLIELKVKIFSQGEVKV